MFTCQLGNEDSRQINIRLAQLALMFQLTNHPTSEPELQISCAQFFFWWLN
jgi:hypothetical protein